MMRWRLRRQPRYDAPPSRSSAPSPRGGGSRESAISSAIAPTCEGGLGRGAANGGVAGKRGSHVDVVLRAWRLLHGGAHRVGGERREIRTPQGPPPPRPAPHRGPP